MRSIGLALDEPGVRGSSLVNDNTGGRGWLWDSALLLGPGSPPPGAPREVSSAVLSEVLLRSAAVTLAPALSICLSVSIPPSGSVPDPPIPAAESLGSVPESEPEPEPAGREPEEAADAVTGVVEGEEESDEVELERDDMNLLEDGGTVADDSSGGRDNGSEDDDDDDDDNDDDCLPINGDETNLRRFDDGPSLTARRGTSRVDGRWGTRALDQKGGGVSLDLYLQQMRIFGKLGLSPYALEASDLDNNGVRNRTLIGRDFGIRGREGGGGSDMCRTERSLDVIPASPNSRPNSYPLPR